MANSSTKTRTRGDKTASPENGRPGKPGRKPGKDGGKDGTKSSGKKPAKKAAKKRGFTAATADKYELYQLAVQSPEEDASFLRRTFQRLRKRKARLLREDFCGTAALSAAWVRKGPDYRAIGYDLDPEPLSWGREHNLAPLGKAVERIQLFQDDARAPGEPVDVRVAQNFSYWVFTERKELLEYFRIARAGLVEDGIFIIDLYGGSESTEEMEEERRIEEGFTYVWDQHEFWPGTGEFVCHIHFRFRDGSRMKKAFTYRWRFWNLTELRDLLYEAGFRQVDPYFEGTAENGEDGNGIFEKDARGENCASWLAYLVAQR